VRKISLFAGDFLCNRYIYIKATFNENRIGISIFMILTVMIVELITTFRRTGNFFFFFFFVLALVVRKPTRKRGSCDIKMLHTWKKGKIIVIRRENNSYEIFRKNSCFKNNLNR
jgi:hypothetical protein